MSSVTPAAPAEVAKPSSDQSETAKMLHASCATRLLSRGGGCFVGSGSRRALEQFNKHAGQRLDTQVASLDTLGVLRAKTTRVCPLECKTGYRAQADACVKIVCRAGFVLGEDGDCEREHERARERKPRTKSASSKSKKSAPKRDSNATSNMMMLRSRAWQH